MTEFEEKKNIFMQVKIFFFILHIFVIDIKVKKSYNMIYVTYFVVSK